ncbi:MAG: phage shock protein PspA [Deltaproteobacteria bacterium]|nr:phage shock protein PspA [Deltaproteobacteria bacterium]
MGIFTRLRDIINSNIGAMLDRAEDPEKLIRLMIQEMEDTLVEIKASCAGAMAEAKKIQRELDQVSARVAEWETRASLALDRGREDLAREALLEKRRLSHRLEGLDREWAEASTLVERYQEDIVQLEEKLAAVREKQRLLIQRHMAAQHQKRARQDLRRADSSEVLLRFAQFENRVERMEAEAELVNLGRQGAAEKAFTNLEDAEEIERELTALKEKQAGTGAE